MMLPIGYNNGLQIAQGQGVVTIQKEMIHETRAIPTKPREKAGSALTTWLGDSQGRWEGDTLVIDTVGFNDRGWWDNKGYPHTEQLHTSERWTRVDEGHMTVEVTIEDLDESPVPGGEIDLKEVVREQIMLALPEQVFCKDDCKGLCPKCGANGNLIDCKCADDEIDPRWAALKNLK